MYYPSVPTADRNFAHAVQLFHALSDETRLGILDMLRDGEQCVCDLQDELGAAQSRLSFHLKVLRDAGLVSDRKEGRWSYYTIVPDALKDVHDIVVRMHRLSAHRSDTTAAGRKRLPQLQSCCG